MTTITEAYVNSLRDDADAFAQRQFGFVVGQSSQGDLAINAIRHAYVSAVLTFYYGSWAAQWFGDSREIGTFNAMLASGSWTTNSYHYKDGFRDLYNNEAGRNAVVNHHGLELSNGQLNFNTIEELIASLYQNGALISDATDSRIPQTLPTDLGTGRILSPVEYYYGPRNPYVPKCFLAATQITMADGTTKPIEEIVPGNLVMAFDERANNGMGALVPGKVTRTLPGIAQDIIDLRGLRVTPGHRFLSDNGEWIPIADCLIEDRAIVEERDGKPVYIRARTGAVVGSTQDVPLLVVFNDPATSKPRGAHIRAGIPWMGQKHADGTYEIWDFARFLEFNKYRILPTGRVIDPDGIERDSVWWPEQGTPLDSSPQQDWIVKLDGQPFMPQWIADIAALDKEGRQIVNGKTRVHTSGSSSVQQAPKRGGSPTFTPCVVGGNASAGATNRKARRKQASLTRVK